MLLMDCGVTPGKVEVKVQLSGYVQVQLFHVIGGVNGTYTHRERERERAREREKERERERDE